MSRPENTFLEYRFENFVLDTERGALLRDGEEVPLRRQSYDVLVHLVKNAGRLVTREELQESVWGSTVVTDASITQCLVDIRAALDDGAHEKIRTLPRRGYRFELPVTGGDPPAPQRVASHGESGRGASDGPGPVRRRPGHLAVAVLGVLVVLAGLWASQRLFTDLPERISSAEPAAHSNSVAVLPFANLSDSEDNAFFADGLSEVILHMLAQRPALKVTARTSSFAFRGRNEDIREIAAALDVAHVLEGSVQMAGERLRVTVQLIRASDGYHLWSQVFDRDAGDLFAIQDEIAGEVAAALDASLREAKTSDSVSTRNLAAYERYLQGLARQQRPTAEQLVEADALFREALDLDPGFHDARVALARNNIYKEVVTIELPNTQLHEARDLLGMVLAERPGDVVALQLASVVDLQINALEGGDLETRSRLLSKAEEAVGRGFGDPWARNYVARFVAGRGRDEDAMAILQQGLALDPLNPVLLGSLGGLYRTTGRPTEARAPLVAAHRVDPDNSAFLLELARTEGDLGDPVAQLEWLRKAVEIDPSQAGLTFEICILLYEMNLPELAQPWRERLEATDASGFRGEWLDMLRLGANREFERLAAMSGPILQRHLTQDTNVGGIYGLTQMYTQAMHRLGRSGEAADFLDTFIPGLYDLVELSTDAQMAEAQLASTGILRDVMEPAAFERALEARIAALDADPRWREYQRTFVYLFLGVLDGDLDGARETVLDEYVNDPPLHFRWTDLLENPWLAPLRADFEVAQRLGEIERARKAERQRVIELLDSPAWGAPAVD